jgi:hypothetical protein
MKKYQDVAKKNEEADEISIYDGWISLCLEPGKNRMIFCYSGSAGQHPGLKRFNHKDIRRDTILRGDAVIYRRHKTLAGVVTGMAQYNDRRILSGPAFRQSIFNEPGG